MELNDKVTQLEDEIKILKNEVQAVLLDIRESFLNNTNPFNMNSIINQPVTPIQVLDPEPPAQGTSIENLIQSNPVRDTEKKPGDTAASGVKQGTVADIRDDDPIQSFVADLPAFADLFGDDAPAFIPNMTLPENKSAKENRNMLNTSAPQFRNKSAIAVADNAIDLETIEKFSEWVDKSVKRLGHERTRTILDITETMGYVESDLKNILVRFIHPDPTNDGKKVTTRDYLTSLVELNQLLKADSRMEVALLFILITFQEYDNR